MRTTRKSGGQQHFDNVVVRWTIRFSALITNPAAISRQLRTYRSNVSFFSRVVRQMSPPISCLCWTPTISRQLRTYRSNVSFFSRVVRQMSPPISCLCWTLTISRQLRTYRLNVSFFSRVVRQMSPPISCLCWTLKVLLLIITMKEQL